MSMLGNLQPLGWISELVGRGGDFPATRLTRGVEHSDKIVHIPHIPLSLMILLCGFQTFQFWESSEIVSVVVLLLKRQGAGIERLWPI